MATEDYRDGRLQASRVIRRDLSEKDRKSIAIVPELPKL